MPAFRKQQSTDSSLSTDNKSDNRTITVREPDPWLGQTANQALFFVTLSKLIQSIYDFKQLMTTATVTMKDGKKAVFSAEHALEHAKGENVGTMRKPNSRRRESITSRLPPSAPASTPGAAWSSLPTPPTTGLSTSSSKTQTTLEVLLGEELSSDYKISPETIEIKDNEILNFIMGYIGADRLKEYWLKKAEQHGGGARGFVFAFVEDMEKRGVSYTIEETVETQMSQLLEAGLTDPSFAGFLEFTSLYEEMNQVCKHPKSDDELAHKYKKLIASLDPKIEMRLDGRIAIIESQMRGRGEKPEDAPIDLITEAAGVVLEEESNLEILKALRTGRGNAFSAQGRFDPQRNTRDQPAGGQTWSNAGPTVHTSDMRDCWFCTNKYKDTPMRKHVDLECPQATKQEKDTLRKERIAKAKAKRDKWNERKAARSGNSGGTSGGANVVKGNGAVDDADAAAAERIFANGNNGDSMLLELGSIIDTSLLTKSAVDGRSLMASAGLPTGRPARAPSDAPSATETTSVSTLLSPNARAAPSSSTATNVQASVDDSHVYVLKPSGNEPSDAVVSGIWCGHWKTQVLPGITFALEQEKQPVDRTVLKNLAVKFESFEEATRKCDRLQIAPIYMGPSPFTDDSGSARLNVGDDVSDFLNGRCASADESSEPGSDSDSSSPGSDRDDDAPTLGEREVQREAQHNEQPAQDEHDDPQLGQLCAEIEGYTLNTHVDILRAAIRRHQLNWNGSPISPSTGGSQRRTKYDILQEMRQAVGAAPLPSSAASTQRRKPDVPMGTPVEPADGRRLDFSAAQPHGAVNTTCNCYLPMLAIIMVQLLALLFGSNAAPPCRMIAPAWVCGSLGYAESVPALPGVVRLDTTSSRRDDLFDRPHEPG